MPRLRISLVPLLVSLAVPAALVWFIAVRFADARHFLALLRQARPWWIAVGILLQLGTYVSSGLIWAAVGAANKYRLPVPLLARLSVEKMTINQLLPTGGLFGNMVVVRAMERLGVPTPIALEALLVDTVTYYASLAGAAFLALAILGWQHHAAPGVIVFLSLFLLVVIAIPLFLLWLLERHEARPPRWLRRFHLVRKSFAVIRRISPEHVRSPKLFTEATALHLLVFLLDSATLWAMLQAVGVAVDPLTAVAGVTMGTIIGTVTFLPSGVGGFEAGATATLALLGVPVEAALAGTLLLRGLTLWVPLAPGIWLARHDVY